MDKNILIEKMIYLISCALNHVIPETKEIENINLSALFQLAKMHSLSSIVAMSLESANILTDSKIAHIWKEEKNKAIRKNMLLDAERDQIFYEMEKAGIWYMPLKGAVLKDYYPQYGMRQMADNDILYDDARQEDVMNIFLQRDYIVKSVGKGVHDVYMKEPVYNFEMHTSLFAESFNEQWAKYYKSIKQKLCLDQGKQYGYHFTDEDFYIYITAHAYKHYSHSGTGLRTLVDTYVFHHKKKDSLNKEYIKNELEKLGLVKFEKENRRLAEKLFYSANVFSIQRLTAQEQQQLFYYCYSGTYGNTQTRVENNLKSLQTDKKAISFITKFKYCCIRLFPGRKWCKTSYPFFYHHPYLLPVFWVYRVIRALLLRGKNIGYEIKVLKNIK